MKSPKKNPNEVVITVSSVDQEGYVALYRVDKLPTRITCPNQNSVFSGNRTYGIALGSGGETTYHTKTDWIDITLASKFTLHKDDVDFRDMWES